MANGETVGNGVPVHLDALKWWLENGRSLKRTAKHFKRSYSTVKTWARNENWKGYVQRLAQRGIENHIGYSERYREILDALADKVQQYIEEQLEISSNREAIELLRLLQADVISTKPQKLEVTSTGGEFAELLGTIDGIVEFAQKVVAHIEQPVAGEPSDNGGVADASG